MCGGLIWLKLRNRGKSFWSRLRISGYYNTGLVKIMLTLMDYSRKIRDIIDLKDRIRTVVSSIPHEMCIRALNRTVARWSLCVKQDGEQVETVL